MPSLPLNIDMRNRKVLVVGGGSVAERKIKSLLAAEAEVLVVAPQVSRQIHQLAESRTIRVELRTYQSRDLDGVFLVIIATNAPHINEEIADEARKYGMLINAADSPESGNCTFPALLRRGNLEIGVSTNGSCPGFAAAVRDYIALEIGEEFGILLETLAHDREKLLTAGCLNTYNTQVLRSRITELVDEHIKRKDHVL